MEDYSKYLYLAIRSVLDAGKYIMDVYTKPVSDFGIECKADKSPLTRADKASHRLIYEVLSCTPIPILSEEGDSISYEERKTWSLYWLVDPLDGTKEFIEQNGDFTVNIALINKGIPVLGVIYVPVTQELYFASQGKGAYKLNSVDYMNQLSYDRLLAKAQRLPFVKRPNTSPFIVVVSRHLFSEETQAYIKSLHVKKRTVEIKQRGSSLKICMIAEGTADVYPRFAPTMEWDTAAGHAIVSEAGKQIYLTDEKTEMVYNKPDLHNPWFVVK